MIEIKKDENIKEKILRTTENIEFLCGNKGKCGKCKVKLVSGKVNDLTETEKKTLTKDEITNNIRLACLIEHRSDIVISEITEKKKTYKNNLDIKEDIIIGIDLGTTTIEIDIFSYNSKDKISSIKIDNPQKKYGGDILSRLNYANESKSNHEKIRMEIVNSINEFNFIQKVKEIFIAGNTIMQYIFMDLELKTIVKPPFEPYNKNSISIEGNKLGINVNKGVLVHSFPLLGGFVGGDTYSVLLDYMSLNNNLENVFIVDIGTNCEILFFHGNTIYTASTPAGPAFEGGNIEYGMRSGDGALKTIYIDENINYTTINDTELKGISGSSLISLINELYISEFIDTTGKLVEKNLIYPEHNFRIRDNKFYIDKKIYISQNDIREFQLAKAAIRGAIETIMEIEEITIKDIKKIVITGNFGKNIDKKSLINIGIVPNIMLDKLDYRENMVSNGILKVIKNNNNIKLKKDIYKNIVYVNLSDNNKFKEYYIKHINF
ncbi:MAG: ATP-binding protein [Fusobacteria bacterium]|nr:ATP-binding protein [Fusobacteriota bacterium]